MGRGLGPIPLNEALLSEVELAVRGSPDPARRLTEGLPGQRLAVIQGDLRSNPRRGRETRASAVATRGGTRCAWVSRPRTTSDRRSPRATACGDSGRPPVKPTAGVGRPAQGVRLQRGGTRCAWVSRPRTTSDRRSPRATACGDSGRPPVKPTAGSGDPRRGAVAQRGGTRCAWVSRPRTTSDRRSPRATACGDSGRPPVKPTAGSGDPPLCEVELAVRGSPDPARRLTEGLPGQRLAVIQGDLRSNPRRGRETRAERFVKRHWGLDRIVRPPSARKSYTHFIRPLLSLRRHFIRLG